MRKLVRTDESDYADSDVIPLNPVDAPPQSVGELLQIKRAEIGVELREAADYLNIRYAYLLAIEEGRVDDLPGAAYAMGFVRAYADYLGLDGPTVVERYKDETSELGDDVRLVFPSPLPEGKIPSVAIILVGLVALLLVYGGWAVFAQKDVKIAELVPALPKQFSSLLDSEESAVVSDQTQAETKDTAPEPTPTTTAAVTPSVTEASTAEAAPAAPETPQEVQTDPTEAAPAVTSEASAVPAANEVPVQPDATERVSEPNATALIQNATGPAEPAAAANEATAKIEEQVAQTAPENDAVATQVEQTPVAAETAPAGSASTEDAASAAANATVPTDRTPDAVEAAEANTEQPAPPPTEQVDTPTAEPVDTAVPAAAQESQEAAPLPPKPPALASAEPRQFGSENAVSRVTIKARIDSWVEIRDRDGDKLLTRVLRAGDSYRVPDRTGLLMETGNAGGLEITVDGNVIPDLGPKGAVRREIALEAESLKAGRSR